jgi:tryptophan-rich sensory protein
MDWMSWYNSLAKPSWTPAPSTIGTIWTILYPIIAVTFGFIVVQAIRRKVPRRVLIPVVVNVVSNVLFTPIQFGLRNLVLASVDIVIVWASIVWVCVWIWPHYRWVAAALVPYFVWVTIATVLQLSIMVMNW